MTMVDTAYIVLESRDPENIAVLVNGALEQGWALQGGISVCQVLENADGHKGIRQQRMSYAQALTKTDDPDLARKQKAVERTRADWEDLQED